MLPKRGEQVAKFKILFEGGRGEVDMEVDEEVDNGMDRELDIAFWIAPLLSQLHSVYNW